MSDIWASLADLWDPENDFSTDPAKWIEKKADEYTWSQQRRVCDSIVEHRYTAVHSAHDLGKSFIASRIMGWWNDSHPPDESFVVSTAPTAAQVSAILWREITKLHGRATLPGRINRAGYPQWFIDGKLVGYGRKPGDYEESAFQGIHERYVLVVIDEAGGVARHLYDAVDSLATNEHARVLAIGNPDDPGSHFASICKPGSDWNVIHLDGLRSPNLTKEIVIGHKSKGFGYDNPRYPLVWALMRAEKIPFSTEPVPERLRDLLISPLWIEERIRRWAGMPRDAHKLHLGAELEDIVRRRCNASPIFTAKVRGNFPSEGSTGVIPLGWVQRAVERWHDVYDHPGEYTKDYPTSLRAAVPGRKVVGVDVAREGEDETAVALRYGNIVEKVETMRLADTTDTQDWVATFLHEPGSMAVVDVIGIGGGVYDNLRRYKTDGLIIGTPIAFNASAQSHRFDAIGEFRFRNDRAAAWWNMRELLDPSKGSNLCLPDDERLIEELVAVKFEHLVGGIIKIESKEDIRKRLGRSTDRADAVIQCFWIEGKQEPIEAVEWGSTGEHGVVRYDGYNPFTDSDMMAHPGLGTQGDNHPRVSPLHGLDDGWDV